MTIKLLGSILVTCVCFAFSAPAEAQSGQWKLKDIVYGNHFGSQNPPDRMELDVNGGLVEFSLRHKSGCIDRYRFTYRFLQDMTVLRLPENSKSLPEYRYEFDFQPLNAPCNPLDLSNFSNPYVTVTNWNSYSGLLSDLKKRGEWKYRYHQQFINDGSPAHYAHKVPSATHAGSGTGTFKIWGPVQKDVDYYLKNYGGLVTDFRILFSGQAAAVDGRANDFYFDVLFLYELERGSVAFDPCLIEMPDCSCCPGTIPVWNFDKNEGQCLKPEA